MATEQISDLTLKSSLLVTDVLPADDSTRVTWKISGQQIVNLVGSGTPENVVYTASNGNDSTGTGDITAPFATSTAAIAASTGTATSPFVNKISPGTYNEPASYPIKPFSIIDGDDSTSCFILPSDQNFVLDSSWTAATNPTLVLKNFNSDNAFIQVGSSNTSGLAILENLFLLDNGGIEDDCMANIFVTNCQVGVNGLFLNTTDSNKICTSNSNIYGGFGIQSIGAGDITFNSSNDVLGSIANVTSISSGVINLNMTGIVGSTELILSTENSGIINCVITDSPNIGNVYLTGSGVTLYVDNTSYHNMSIHFDTHLGNPTVIIIDNKVVTVTGTGQQMSVNTKYIANNASTVTLPLPTIAAAGDWVEIVMGENFGGFIIAQIAGQVIHMGNVSTTSGASGYLQTIPASGFTNIKLSRIDVVNHWSVDYCSAPITAN